MHRLPRHLCPRTAAALVVATALSVSACATGLRQVKLPALYEGLVRKLSADEMQGRGIATDGNRLAAELLARSFADAGLVPAGDNDTFFQCFPLPVALRAETATLSVGARAVAPDALIPASFSSSGAFAGELLFAGYGIHAPEQGYDDYADLDVAGKVLVLLRYEPRERDKDSPLNGDRPSRHSELRRKVFEARGRGAKAVLIVATPRAGEPFDERLPSLQGRRPDSAAGLPVAHVRPSVVDAWLKDSGSVGLVAAVEQIDRSMRTVRVALGVATGQLTVTREERQLCNVVGVHPGAGDLADQAIVIGAHFDHLGMGQDGSLAPGEPQIHNGADDNASGAAGLSVLARRLAPRYLGAHRRTVIVVAFNAEEVGLAGAGAYLERPVVPLKGTVAMLNMDMIGRLRDDRLIALGADSADVWRDWLAAAGANERLDISARGDGHGPSDQAAFYSRGVPVLHFFTGPHDDYHRPTDDADLVNYAGAVRVLRVVAAVAERAATTPQPPVYRQGGKTASMFTGDSRSYGAWLGTVPDYAAMAPTAGGGVLLAGVRAQGPAETAGMRKGDRIVRMAGRDVDNLHDMMFVLRDHRPGEVVAIEVRRAGQTVQVAAKLGSRAELKHTPSPQAKSAAATLLFPGEEQFISDVRQLTFEGENAEAYFSPDGRRLVFQARPDAGQGCDAMFTFDLQTNQVTPVSSGKGRTTCGYFTYPDGDSILYSSTHLAGDACPPEPDRSQGYVWPIYDSYDIFEAGRPDGALRQVTHTPGYDAEATVCFVDGRTVFTSTRDGDLDLYVMDLKAQATPGSAGTPATRITHELGYDGGAFFSPDCSKLVWRASRPTGEAAEQYKRLLAQGLVRPSAMEIMVAAPDGSGARALTSNGHANFAPYFLPDNRRVILASNLEGGGRNFDLYLVDSEAGPDQVPVRVTHSPVFESFPMFSPDGRMLVFASNRNADKPGDTNLFIARWIEGGAPPPAAEASPD